MNIKNLKLNRENTKKFHKNKISLIDKKITILDSDINKLYKKYANAKKERRNQEKNQLNIINRIKYLEDEERKMRLKCEIQKQKINSLSKKLAKNKTRRAKHKVAKFHKS